MRPARHLRVGGHRRRLQQAVRVPAALPGARPRRRLHPGRAALPGLAAARVRLLRAADRRGPRGQREMPNFVLQKVGDALNDVAADQGLADPAARRGIQGRRADTRESPSLEVMRQLAARGGDVRYCDPLVPALDLDGERYTSVDWSAEEVAEADCVVCSPPHREFLEAPRWDRTRAHRRHAQRRAGRRERAQALTALSRRARAGARPLRSPRRATDAQLAVEVLARCDRTVRRQDQPPGYPVRGFSGDEQVPSTSIRGR